MSRLPRSIIAVPAIASLLWGGALVGTAAAAPSTAQQTTLSCGSTVTESVTLTHDIGPCPGDGLIVAADNVTLDLNGHTITGPHGTKDTPPAVEDPAPGEHVGINLMRVSGVTVQNGEVHGFDSGVGIGHGSGNTVRNLNAHHNINHSALGGEINNCNFGDGITVVNSDDNRIVGNRVAHNGPMSGIALVGDSDGNQVVRNQVAHNNIKALTPEGEGILCGTGEDQGPMSPGRDSQNVGIRIEGPGANDNRVANNVVTDSALAGIAIHGNVCGDTPSAPTAPPNNGNTIQNNRVTNTGRTTHEDDPHAHGIALLASGPADVVCVASETRIVGNDSSGNYGHGIFIGGRGSHGQQITANTVNNNGLDGIHLAGPPSEEIPGVVDSRITGNRATGNAGVDGFDGTPGCDDNMWRGNQFGTVNQACVAGPGGGAAVK